MEGFVDYNKHIYDPENLEYILEVHCGLSTERIEQMSLAKGLRYAKRRVIDSIMTRPDTYLRPLAEQMPTLMNDLEKNRIDSLSSMGKTNIHKKHVYNFKFNQFPKNWKK